VASLEGNNLVVIYYLGTSEVCPGKRGGLWWEWPYKRVTILSNTILTVYMINKIYLIHVWSIKFTLLLFYLKINDWKQTLIESVN